MTLTKVAKLKYFCFQKFDFFISLRYSIDRLPSLLVRQRGWLLIKLVKAKKLAGNEFINPNTTVIETKDRMNHYVTT